MKTLFTLSLLAGLSIGVACGQAWIDQAYSYDSLLQVPYGSAVNFHGDLAPLHLDLYLPECGDAADTFRRPLLIWIHGGAFLAGDKSDASIRAHCRNFARRGYVTASINYRLGFVSDESLWQCNYPNYSCVFATDSLEWVRAYYRGIQDAKGALRYLINRHATYRIDTSHVFVAGESAGAFIALGVGLMDTVTERPPQTLAAASVPPPNANTLGCAHNQGIVFTGDSISRPDLGGIQGDIEPTTVTYTIKGIGNIYGAMMDDLLKEAPANQPKPAIYSFHQPCDLVVPIDSNYVYWGISWCFTNGYNCFGIVNNNNMLYGSRTFSDWNQAHGYGYDIQNDFTNVNFPYQFLLGQGSCLDQANKPCHAYDNRALREQNLAAFFASKITISGSCDPSTSLSRPIRDLDAISVYPNPTDGRLQLSGQALSAVAEVRVYDLLGQEQPVSLSLEGPTWWLDLSHLPPGLYHLSLSTRDHRTKSVQVVKQ